MSGNVTLTKEILPVQVQSHNLRFSGNHASIVLRDWDSTCTKLSGYAWERNCNRGNTFKCVLFFEWLQTTPFLHLHPTPLSMSALFSGGDHSIVLNIFQKCSTKMLKPLAASTIMQLSLMMLKGLGVQKDGHLCLNVCSSLARWLSLNCGFSLLHLLQKDYGGQPTWDFWYHDCSPPNHHIIPPTPMTLL
jgi:hypothetical protein